MKKALLTGIALLAILPVAADARIRVFAGPALVPYGWYGWYASPYAWGRPYFGPYDRYWAYGISPNAGRVKLVTNLKSAEVLLNGNYAGTVGELKTMTLRAGDYTIDVRAPGHIPFHRSIHVLAGKTMKLHPDLPPETRPGPAGS